MPRLDEAEVQPSKHSHYRCQVLEDTELVSATREELAVSPEELLIVRAQIDGMLSVKDNEIQEQRRQIEELRCRVQEEEELTSATKEEMAVSLEEVRRVRTQMGRMLSVKDDKIQEQRRQIKELRCQVLEDLLVYQEASCPPSTPGSASSPRW